MSYEEIAGIAVIWLIWLYANGMIAFHKRRYVAGAMVASLFFTPLPVTLYLLFVRRTVSGEEKAMKAYAREVFLQEAIQKALAEKERSESKAAGEDASESPEPPPEKPAGEEDSGG
jgi:hypothetical protein